ncbi:hypothetical protein K652_28663 [Pseudomonas aeruginosa VRFPA02]|nr:hypothetical protein A6748_24205 [Pseudomonas aeruginosa]EOQ77233.1 hypothetical protein K652_28663 [Pseudomonas aeruginosa VRFPA02]CDI92663.1 hypothetical protein BN889_04632 [Pseudomonas aeruginosa PA38182]
MQVRIGRFDGVAGYPQRLRQRPRGRQRIARRQRTVEDQLADRALDSRMQRQGLELWMEEARLDRLEQ